MLMVTLKHKHKHTLHLRVELFVSSTHLFDEYARILKFKG